MEQPESKVNILLVDDRPENLVALDAILKPLGQNLIQARSGKEALKYVLDREFAVILLDVMMPGMDGFETAAMIRERDKSCRTPIIFITAMFNEESHAARGYELGAVDYIMKPFVPEILRSKVMVFVDLYRKTEEVRQQSEHIRQIEVREHRARLAEAQRRIDVQTYISRLEQHVSKAITAHAPMGLVRLNSEGAIIEVNEVFTQQFGVQFSAVQGMNAGQALPWLPPKLVQALKQGQQLRIEKFRLENQPAAGNHYYDLAIWPVQAEESENLGSIICSVDVTEQVLLDQQREDFVATLAHDLQTPVIASDRALEILLDRASSMDPAFASLLSMLKLNNQNLLRMIQGLLDVYRYEAGVQPLYFDDVDVQLLLQSCVSELIPLAEKCQLELRQTFAPETLLAKADRTAIRRVITNLIDNSIKFTPQGGAIEVSARAEGNMVVLEVNDNGVGIPEDYKANLFKRYWHGSGHNSYKTSCGLGLYLCAQIVEAHQGEISCISDVGKSTTFTVKLPMPVQSESIPAPESERPNQVAQVCQELSN